MTSLTVQAVYKGGRINVKEPGRLTAWKARLDEGVSIAVTFEQWEEARSRRQQRLLHELLGRYARQMNDNMGRVKMEFKIALGHWLPADKLLNRIVEFPKWKGEWVDLHSIDPFLYIEGTFAFVRSESTYTRRMEIEFIDTVIAACSDNGVYIDDILETLDLERRSQREARNE